MLTQEFNLNMVPDSEPVVIHVNQYDYGTGRFIIHLYDGDTAYTPASGATVKIEGEKPDGNVFSYSASLSGNTVTADVEIQMTAASGRVPTQLIITETGRVTGTFLFWMDVQESAINEKSPVSETEIPAIIEGAERQAQRAESAADTAVEASSEAETSKNSAASSAIAAAGSAADAKISEDNAKDSEDNAAQSEKDAEAWARGTRGGVAVPSTDETYHNNSKYYSEQAENSSEDSEAWAEGTRDGDPVPPTDPTYHHNAKYWAEQAQEVADIHLMDNETTGIGRPDGSTAEATEGVFSAIGTTIVASINPEATADYADDWLLDANDEVINPDSRRQYRVTIRGKEMLFYWNGEEYAPLGSSGHTILNASALPMAGMSNLQFEEMSVENEELTDKTVIRQTQIVNTEAEWNQMLTNDEVDPNVTYYLPWMSSTEYAADRTPIGTVISVTTAKTGEVSGITTPTGEFPSSDYLVCDGAVKQIADYPKLADWFLERYGSKNYFGGNGTTTFAVPDFTTDFPTNGVLAIKAQMASTRVTYAEVDDSLTTSENVWSAEKVNARAVSIEEYIYHMNRRTMRDITSEITADKGAKLIAAVAEQNLAKYGYAIGDFFTGASGQQYNLGDMDPNYGVYNNQAVVNTHHIGIVVDSKQSTPWLSSGSVTNYSSSTLHSFLAGTVMNNVKSDFKAIFGGSTGTEHLLTRTEIDNAINGWGTTWEGLKNCLIVALTEVQVYSSRVFGADGFQTGTGNKQLEIFRKFRFNEIFGNVWFWLKSLSSASDACVAYRDGSSGDRGVSLSAWAVGLILFH